jgi:ABC-type antimicrobial peptide transport system permease subunit
VIALNNRVMGLFFILLASFFFTVKYLVAAIIYPEITSWYTHYWEIFGSGRFREALNEVGIGFTLATIACIFCAIYYLKKDRKPKPKSEIKRKHDH